MNDGNEIMRRSIRYMNEREMANSKHAKISLIAVCTAILVLLGYCTAFADDPTPHREFGPVNNAVETISNGSTVRVYEVNRPYEIATGEVGVPISGWWDIQVGTLLSTQWQAGDEHIALVDKEINSGTSARAGFYSIVNHTITSNNDTYNTTVLRPIPVPVGTPGDNQANLNWAVATEDAGSPVRANIAGYRILRSTSQTGPYTFLATVEGSTSYTDSTAVNGTTYYYVIQLVYRVEAGTALTSLYYSANSNAVTPSAGGSAPTVTGVTPDTGVNTSTTPVTITGTNFTGVTAVNIGTWPVDSYTVVDPTTITAVIPSGLPAATYHVTVTNGYGTSATSSADQFTVTAPVSTVPTVTGVDPDNGENTSTTVVTIEGTNFTGVTAVNIGTWPVDSYTVTDPTSITAVIPAGLPVATYHVTVTNGSGTSATSPADQFTVTSGSGTGIVIDDFEYYADKDYRGMMDYYYESGSGADEVTIPAVANSTTTVQESVRSMEITYPGAVGAQWGGYWGGGLTAEVKDLTPYTGVSLWVKGDGTANTISINLLEADVASVTQETYASTSVTLTDTNWHEVEIPFSAFVRDPYGKQLEGTFSKIIKGYTIMYRGTDGSVTKHYVDYIVAKNVSVSATPTVTGIVPDTGPNNTTTDVVISGTNFGGTTAVQIGTWPVSSFTVNSAIEISAVIPSGLPVGPHHVTVTNPYGTSALTAADIFTVTSPTTPASPPVVTGINPDTGENTTSTEVTITGTDLDGATEVHIGTFEMTIVSVTPTQIVAIVPPGIPAGDYHITVTTPNGTSDETPNDVFTVTEPSGPATDDTPPVISDVAFDGKLVLDGDFVGRTPVITALLTDNVAIDSSTIRVQLVNVYDTSSVPAVTFDPVTGRMELVITSPLPYGETVFTINVSDTSGNTAEFRIILNGNDGNVFNYPNPFDPINGTTKIAFNISENTQVMIYMFDMTGRIVVRRAVNATVGFNEYEWDGKDDYGAIASNGVYLLRLISGNRLIGKTKVWVIKR